MPSQDIGFDPQPQEATDAFGVWQYYTEITVGSSLSFLILLPLNGDTDEPGSTGCYAKMESL